MAKYDANYENHGAEIFRRRERILRNGNEVDVERHSKSGGLGRPHHTRFSLKIAAEQLGSVLAFRPPGWGLAPAVQKDTTGRTPRHQD